MTLDTKKILLVSSAAALLIILLVTFGSMALSGSEEKKAAGITGAATTLAAAEVARRKLTETKAQVGQAEKGNQESAKQIEEIKSGYDTASTKNEKDISLMTLEEKVRLANGESDKT